MLLILGILSIVRVSVQRNPTEPKIVGAGALVISIPMNKYKHLVTPNDYLTITLFNK